MELVALMKRYGIGYVNEKIWNRLWDELGWLTHEEWSGKTNTCYEFHDIMQKGYIMWGV